jgi:hypothetical protein
MSIATGLELAGMSSLAIAAWLISPILGFVATGAALIIIGLGMDRSSK